jgi:septation ring formation regulator EzrA
MTLSVEAKEEIKKIHLEIEDLFITLDKEIDAVVEKAKNASCVEKALKHFTKLMATTKKDKDEAEQDFKNDKEPQTHRLWYQWFDLNSEIVLKSKRLLKKLVGARNLMAI